MTEWEWPRIRCEILVERDSQKAHRHRSGRRGAEGGGDGRAPGAPAGAYLELFVRVEKHWQQRDDALDRLGY